MKNWVLISGASSGIGAATARRLARAGWGVVLVARGADPLARMESEIRANGGRALAIPTDAADGNAVKLLIQRVVRECGPVDVLINCAGAGEWRFIEETTPDQIRSMMEAPFFAAFHLSHAVMPEMLRRRSGLIIHVNSPVSSMGWPGATGYMCARWALRGLHEALCLDLSGTDVRSSHVVFGKVSSDYFVNNPGSEERLPKVATLVPTITPEVCAKILESVIERPRREVFYPFMLRLFVWANLLAPGIVRALSVRTGRRHLPTDKPAG